MRFLSVRIDVLSVLFLLVVVGNLRAQTCLEVDELPSSALLSATDTEFLEDFGVALRRFQGMSLDEFLAEYGPTVDYRLPRSEEAADAPGAEGTFIRGDGDRDGTVDISDALCLLGYLFVGGGSCASASCEDALDANDSGDLSITDAIFVLDFLFGGTAQLPPPSPEAGLDPTEDSLTCGTARVLDYDPMEAEYLELITAQYPLTGAQEEAYRENGFVILQERKFSTFFHALDAAYQQHLPVYISADALFDALHLSFNELLLTIEEHLLVDRLDAMLQKMDEGIDDLRAYAGGRNIEADLDGVAAWICTARSLLRGEKVPCGRAVDATVEEFLAHVASEEVRSISLVRAPNPCEPHREDFSQFRARGHYTRSEQLEKYFRAMMWVQRIGMQWLRQGTATQYALSDRHAAAAYLLTRSLYDTGAIDDWRRIDAVVDAFVGTSDSLGPPGMIDLVEQSGIRSVADLYEAERFLDFVRVGLATGAGKQLINSQILSQQPTAEDGFTPIPPAFHVMGQRFIVDSFVFSNVVWDRVPCGFTPTCFPQDNPCRVMPSPLDALFVLGNRATVPLLEGELRRYSYHANLAALDWIVSRYPESFWNANLFNVWLSALRVLGSDTTRAPYPSVMQTEAWARRTTHAQLGSWAQLRHDTLLYSKQSYGIGSCDYPDGWIDPYPELYAQLAAFGERLERVLEPLGVFELDTGETFRVPWNRIETDEECPAGPCAAVIPVTVGEWIRHYVTSLASHSRRLESIARAELDGTVLSEIETDFLRSAVKDVQFSRRCGGSGYDGWYPELIFGYTFYTGGFPKFAPAVADVHTYPCGPDPTLYILHAGVGHPNLMLVSVKNDCGVKSYIGPVFSYHEFVQTDARMTDEEWATHLWPGHEDHFPGNPGDDPERLFIGQEPPRPEWAYDFVR